jgi:uncharacterized protein (DUF1330 family)
MTVYALNLFDLAANDDYRAYSKRSVDAVGKHGGTVTALGRIAGAAEGGDTDPRQVMVLVEWPSREAFDAFVADPAHEDLHPLRERGTERYLWWLFDRLDDLRPLFALGRDDLVSSSAARVIGYDPGVVWPVAADARRLADWMSGVDEVTVTGHAGMGLRHVARGPQVEVERVCELWEPQAHVRWRDLDGAGSWLDLRLEPGRLGTTHVTLEARQLEGSDAWREETAQRLAESLERLEAVLDGEPRRR